jgi:GMP synthase-like glutamine amidotransferase
MTRIHCFQHVSFETPAHLTDWAAEHHYPVTTTRFYEGELPPEVRDYDWLVVLGGPMGANDEATHPWLTVELGAIEAALTAGKTVVGVCLGAQLVARVLGARVYPIPEREIGWFEVTLTAAADRHPLTEDVPESFTPLHWHGDTFDLPSGAVHLARSEACAQQMFALGRNVLGLQFHLEMNEATVAALAEHNVAQLVEGPYIQDHDEIVGETTHLQSGHDILDSILARL